MTIVRGVQVHGSTYRYSRQGYRYGYSVSVWSLVTGFLQLVLAISEYQYAQGHIELNYLEFNIILEKLITKQRSNMSQNRMTFRVFRTNYAYLFDQELERILEDSKQEQAQRRSKGIVIKDQVYLGYNL
ncbi:hypothetical protein GQ457_01G019670 [Hibiscus cannabinus]